MRCAIGPGATASRRAVIRRSSTAASRCSFISSGKGSGTVLDGAGDRPATLSWCSDLTAMYRAWAEKRRMQIRDLPSVNASRAAEDPILLVSGFGAHRVLGVEAG